MVTLTPEQFDHAINTIAWLCIVMGMVGALAMQLLQGLLIGLVTKVTYLIDRKHRIDMSRKRAARWRSLGERFVGVADRMDLRHEARERTKTAAMPAPGAPDSSDPPGHYCTENYSTHDWVGGVCVTCGGRADWERASC